MITIHRTKTVSIRCTACQRDKIFVFIKSKDNLNKPEIAKMFFLFESKILSQSLHVFIFLSLEINQINLLLAKFLLIKITILLSNPEGKKNCQKLSSLHFTFLSFLMIYQGLLDKIKMLLNPHIIVFFKNSFILLIIFITPLQG